MKQAQREEINNVYVFLCEYMTAHGLAPSVREIAEALYMSPSTVSRYLDKLAIAGRIVRQPGIARGILLCDPPGKRR